MATKPDIDQDALGAAEDQGDPVTHRKPVIPVEVGQVRRDPDPRKKGARTVMVERIDGRFTYILSSAGARTRILYDAIVKWPLVNHTETL